MRWVAVVLLGAGLAACASAPAAGAPVGVTDHPARGEIVGVVSRDAGAEPLAHVTVALVPAGANRAMTTATDERGRFAFRGVAPGHYVVHATQHDAGRAIVVHLPADRGRRVHLALPGALLAPVLQGPPLPRHASGDLG